MRAIFDILTYESLKANKRADHVFVRLFETTPPSVFHRSSMGTILVLMAFENLATPYPVPKLWYMHKDAATKLYLKADWDYGHAHS